MLGKSEPPGQTDAENHESHQAPQAHPAPDFSCVVRLFKTDTT